MNKFKMLSTAVLLTTFIQVYAQTAGPDPKRYCVSKTTGAEATAEIVMVNGNPQLKCINGSLNALAFYEMANINFNRSSNEKSDRKFFKSEKWLKFVNAGYIYKFETSNPNSKPCTISEIKGENIIECGEKDPKTQTNVTADFEDFSNNVEGKYKNGKNTYLENKSAVDLKTLYAAKSQEIQDEKNKNGLKKNYQGPLGAEFWESLLPGKVVDLKLTKEQQQVYDYTWGIPSYQDDKYKINTLSDFYPITISDQYTNQPTVTDKDPTSDLQIIDIKPSDVSIQGPVTVNTVGQTVISELDVKEEKEEKEEEEGSIEQKNDEVIVKEEVKTSDCKEKLNLEIAKLLEDDKKNIIGLQYELTVLKMASAATAVNSKTLEGLIKNKNEEIKNKDTDIIAKMNAMYKAHGLPEDAKAIKDHLHEKAANANYFPKDKRFFNQDSSAFLLAYQSLDETAGIKDADVSVLWLMDKVSEKAKTKQGEKFGTYSSEHNRTNLSTRIAQYTGAVDPAKALSKEKLDEMIVKQKSKIDTEFLSLIQGFKESNLACYNELFAAGENECDNGVSKIEVSFSELLAINAKIPSTDLVTIDANLKGGIDKTRFKISKYVD